jgi:multisubunit Na+/H+ antiporter MnhC subunit
MTRETFVILALMLIDVILLLIFDFLNFVIGMEILSYIIPGILVLIGLSCFTKKGFEFWTKKIKFNK